MARNTGKKTRYPGVVHLGENRYRIRVCRRQPGTGKPIQRTRTVTGSLNDAVQARVELDEALLAELEGTGLEGRGAATTTVASYVTHYLETKASRYKFSTLERYRSYASDWLLPPLGHLNVTDVDRITVKRWVSWAEKQRKANGDAYSKATLVGIWTFTKMVLQEAAADFGLNDPTFRVPGPTSRRARTREQRTLTKAQMDALVAAAKKVPEWYAEVVTLCRTGMRPGELYALHRKDIDEKNQTITICRSHVRGHLSTTKTDSPRVVPVPDEVLKAMTEHRMRMVREKHPGAWGDLIFPSESGTLRTAAPLRQVLHHFAASAGIEIRVTPQVLRRSWNTILVESGVPEPVIRSMMGHSSQRMTILYSGVQEEAKRAALDKVLGP